MTVPSARVPASGAPGECLPVRLSPAEQGAGLRALRVRLLLAQEGERGPRPGHISPAPSGAGQLSWGFGSAPGILLFAQQRLLEDPGILQAATSLAVGQA